MSKTIKLKRGLDIKLVGQAEEKISQLPLAERYGVSPLDFQGVTPRLLVREGDRVEAGTPLFFDKDRPDIMFTSPVSGSVEAVVRGEKRKVLDVVVLADKESEQKAKEFKITALQESSREEVAGTLLETGLWGYLLQRPYGIIANPKDAPNAIFISGFDSAPLAPNLNFILKDQVADVQKGIDVLAKLTDGYIHIGVREGEEKLLNEIGGVRKSNFMGPHPAGNVGVQIHHVDPISKGDIIWTIDLQSVAIIGRFYNSGKFDLTRTYAITGSQIEKPTYVRAISGAPISEILKNNICQQKEGDSIRVINGNVLTGRLDSINGYASYTRNQITVIPEGDKYELLGWAMPRLNKFSVSRSYFSWLCPKKKHSLDTNLNGGRRAFIFTGLFEKYLPMDIYPLYLLKAILAKDIDKMENLGIYEIVEEDLAVCEFVDPTKNDIQKIVREGIDYMIKELS